MSTTATAKEMLRFKTDMINSIEYDLGEIDVAALVDIISAMHFKIIQLEKDVARLTQNAAAAANATLAEKVSASELTHEPAENAQEIKNKYNITNMATMPVMCKNAIDEFWRVTAQYDDISYQEVDQRDEKCHELNDEYELLLTCYGIHPEQNPDMDKELLAFIERRES